MALVGAASTSLEFAALPATALLELEDALVEPVAFCAAAPPNRSSRDEAVGAIVEAVLLSCCHTEALKDPDMLSSLYKLMSSATILLHPCWRYPPESR